MKPLFGAKPELHKAIDMGDMPIANDKSDCNTCPCKAEGCTKIAKTLNCLLTRKRYDRSQEDLREKKEQEDEERVDPEMAKAEKQVLADMLKQAMAEAQEEDEDNESEKVKPRIESQNVPQKEDDDDDDEE